MYSNHRILYVLIVIAIIGLQIFVSYKTKLKFILGSHRKEYIRWRQIYFLMSLPLYLYIGYNERKNHCDEKDVEKSIICFIQKDKYALILFILSGILFNIYTINKNKNNMDFIKYSLFIQPVVLIVVMYFGFVY